MAAKKQSEPNGKGRVLTADEKRNVLAVLDTALKASKDLQLHVERAKKQLRDLDFSDI